jgi:hypothetical protein
LAEERPVRALISARAARALIALWIALAAVAVVSQLTVGDAFSAAIAPLLAVLAAMGLLLCLRRPENPIGPLLLALALLMTLSVAMEGVYRQWDADAHPPVAVRVLVASDEAFGLVWISLVGLLLPLLFPTGRPPSRRWRPLLWGGLAVVAVVAVATALGPPRLDWETHGSISNPIAVGGAAGEVLRTLKAIGEPVVFVVMFGALVSLGVRLRRSSGIERQQLKSIVLALSTTVGGLLLTAVAAAVGWDALSNVGWFVFVGALIVGMPIAIALAILRYRLYDIDLVIRRTLVYAVLTATLAATYLGLVLLIGLAVGRSGFAVAVSTLAVAALFRPARARIQAAVDKRFYRRRYDAAQTLEAFGAHLRDELDLEALAADVRQVVRDTVQPAHVSLWIRGGR